MVDWTAAIVYVKKLFTLVLSKVESMGSQAIAIIDSKIPSIYRRFWSTMKTVVQEVLNQRITIPDAIAVLIADARKDPAVVEGIVRLIVAVST